MSAERLARWTAATAVTGLALALFACGRAGDDGQRVTAASAPTAAASAPPVDADAAPVPPGGRMRIPKNTQATIDDVRIGVGNIWEEDYTDESGAAKKGMRAGFWLSVRDDPAADRTIRVHIGQQVTVSKLRIEVMSIDKTGVEVSVAR